MCVRILWLWIAAALPAQVSLADLPKLARDRAEHARPTQEKALGPFWDDLALEYSRSQQVLDQRIAQVAALGDSVVPLLLEKLQPSQGSDASRHLASNCRRVLERLDPSSFLDALVELVGSKNEISREEAIQLLGRANSPKAADVLVNLLERTAGRERLLVVRSLRQLKSQAAAPKVVGMLASNDRQVREEVLNYLIDARPAKVCDTVAQAMLEERDDRLLRYYVEYFAAAVQENDMVARAMLTLIGDRLDFQDKRRLIEALGSVAPKDHEPTCRRLNELLDAGETSALSVQVAVTLRRLGDKHGVTRLKKLLDGELRKPQRRKDAPLYEQRASLSFAIEDYDAAESDYEKILEFSDGLAMTRRAHIGLIRCEANRKRLQHLTRVIKASGLNVAEIEAIGIDDPAVREALGNDKVRAFLQALAKDMAPK